MVARRHSDCCCRRRFTCPRRDGESLEANRDAFTRLGFELEPFGGHSVIVHAVPTPHRRFDALKCLRESLAALSGDRGATAHAGHELLVATVACKAAVKAGEPLAPDEMQALFRALRLDRAAGARRAWSLGDNSPDLG